MSASAPGPGPRAGGDIGRGAQTRDRVPGAAQACRDYPGAPGCAGQVAQLAGQAMRADVGAQVAVPVFQRIGAAEAASVIAELNAVIEAQPAAPAS